MGNQTGKSSGNKKEDKNSWSFENCLKKVSDSEFQRIKRTFDNLSTKDRDDGTKVLDLSVFHTSVLSEKVPLVIAKDLFLMFKRMNSGSDPWTSEWPDQKSWTPAPSMTFDSVDKQNPHCDKRSWRHWYLISGDWWRRWKAWAGDNLSRASSNTGESFSHQNGPTPSSSSRGNEINLSVANLIGQSYGNYPELPTTSNGSATFIGNGPITGHSSVSSPSSRDDSTRVKPGSIDNSPLLQTLPDDDIRSQLKSLTKEGGYVRENLIEGVDFHVVSRELWDALCQWHNSEGPAIPRPLFSKTNTLDPYPLTFIVLRHYKGDTRVPTGGKQIDRKRKRAGLMSSMVEGVRDLGASLGSGYRRIPSFTVTCPTDYNLHGLHEYLCAMLEVKPEMARIWSKAADKSYNLEESMAKGVKELAPESGAGGGGAHVISEIIFEICDHQTSVWPEELLQLGKKEFHATKKNSVRGVVGLTNLGYSCFMNSALQCISNTDLLRDKILDKLPPSPSSSHRSWFSSHLHLSKEPESLAKAFAAVLGELWSESRRTVSLTDFRHAVSKYRADFVDTNQQHDCQEFLQTFLDRLHEEMNSVPKQKYDTIRDSDGRDDKEVAQENWDYHLKYNQSMMVDFFHGLLKSKVTCAQCTYTSARFEPYSMLSLELELDSYEYFDVIVQFIHPFPRRPISYTIEVLRGGQAKGLLDRMSKLTGIDMDQLLIYYVSDGKPCFLRPSDRLQQVLRRRYVAFQLRYSANEKGIMMAVHRRMEPLEDFVLAHNGFSSQTFGPHIVVEPFGVVYHEFETEELDMIQWTGRSLYAYIWRNVSRHVDKPGSNHAVDCDQHQDFERNPPFVLRHVDEQARYCSQCPWQKFCYGCRIDPHSDEPLDFSRNNDRPVTCISIDWSMSVLHLNFNYAEQVAFDEDSSVKTIRAKQAEHRSIYECLSNFTKPECLKGNEEWFCEKCKTRREAVKKLDIWKVPPILIIHLKRFICLDMRMQTWAKSHQFVDFPLEALDLDRFVGGHQLYGDSLTLYDLYAVSNHYGNISSGHYVTFAKNPNGNWYLFNDSICKEVSETEIDKGAAYLLFYKRRSQI